MPEHRTHTNKPGIVGPIGKCIYGDDHPTDKLSKEHVLPLGLSGGVILTKASCAACRNTTSAFERICLRQNFGLVRAHRNMPTRRPDERPTHGKLFVHDNGKEKVRDVPLSEHPNVLALPEFSATPAYMTGSLAPPHIRLRMYGDADEIQRRADLHADATIFVGGRFDTDAFVRLLAKIGHGMMWASYKTENIRPLLLPIILDGQTADAWHLIGAGFRPMPKLSPDLGAGANLIRCETVEIPNHGVCIIAAIQLFAEWGAPTYAVICGEADSLPPSQPVTR
jgi:hypothetical protein